jgi:hypothetical protein
VGPKFSAPVPVRSSLHRDALIQSALDPSVESIGFIGKTHLQGQPIALEITTILRDGIRYYLDIVEERVLRDIDCEGLLLLSIEERGLIALERRACDILQEPRHSNCRSIWQHRNERVSAADQIEVLRILGDEGPQRLDRLCRLVRMQEPELLALACQDLIEVDVHSARLGSNTMIRRRDRIKLPPPRVLGSIRL